MTGRNVETGLLEQVLASIPGFSGAKIDSQLSDGPTNTSYLLERGDGQYVLRLDKPEALKLGLNRDGEKRACTVVAAAGLAPEPLYFDPAAGVYLRRYLPGRSWLVSDLAEPGKLRGLARLLRALHQLPRVGAGFDPLAAARRYAAQLDGEHSRSVLHEAEKLMCRIDDGAPLPTLCHNDLVCQNVLEGEQLMLIDWEYAGIGNPFFDLAVVVRHHGLDDKSARFFLDAYLGRTASVRERDHLDLQCDFYACLLELWEQALL